MHVYALVMYNNVDVLSGTLVWMAKCAPWPQLEKIDWSVQQNYLWKPFVKQATATLTFQVHLHSIQMSYLLTCTNIAPNYD